MSNNCVGLSVYGIPSSGTRIYSWHMNWPFGIYSLWWDELSSMHANLGAYPALTWHAMLCWLPWKALFFLNGDRRGCGGKKELKREEEGETLVGV